MTKRGLKQYYEVISAYFVLKAVNVTTQQQQENISVFAARLLLPKTQTNQYDKQKQVTRTDHVSPPCKKLAIQCLNI